MTRRLRLHLAIDGTRTACGEPFAASTTSFAKFVTCDRCRRSVQYRQQKAAHDARVAAGECIGDIELARQRELLRATREERHRS